MSRSIRTQRRPAAAIMIALVVVLVVGLISSLSLRAILKSIRQSRDEQQRLQAELIADAALGRAAAMLRKDAAWKGETWNVSASESGSAEIRVQPSASRPNELKISVIATYPSDPIHRAQARREMTLSAPQAGEKP